MIGIREKKTQAVGYVYGSITFISSGIYDVGIAEDALKIAEDEQFGTLSSLANDLNERNQKRKGKNRTAKILEKKSG